MNDRKHLTWRELEKLLEAIKGYFPASKGALKFSSFLGVSFVRFEFAAFFRNLSSPQSASRAVIYQYASI
ncbi:MAG: hypothetical protein ACLQVJ_22865 [Syntrophobacteraceae bacterium]